MTKRRRKDKKPSNKDTMIEYVDDKLSLNQLRKLSRLTSEKAHELTRDEIEKCFFCEEIIDETNSNECHLVPESFLKLISEKDKVSTIDSISSLQTKDPANFFNSEIYKNSALTFFGACRNCDGPEFFEYENKPMSDLTQGKMREIALKTLLAFRYASLHKYFQADLTLEWAKASVRLDLGKTQSATEIEKHLSNHEGILTLASIRDEAAIRVLAVISEAIKIRDYKVSFSKILDFEVQNKPVIAVQSFYVCGQTIAFVNVFPTNSGSRIIVFKNEGETLIEDDRYVLNLSVIDVIANSMAFFRKSLAISPEASSKFVDGDSIFDLLGPRSLKFTTPDDLRKISMKDLRSELNLQDARMFKRLHEFL